jgi:DsbC/DsbD-like thiol-disulfide interchange protein
MNPKIWQLLTMISFTKACHLIYIAGFLATASYGNELPNTQISALIEPDANPVTHSYRIAVTLKPAPGWHMYWENPGDVGQPFTGNIHIESKTSGHITWQHPAPLRKVFSGITSYVHPGNVTIVARLKLTNPTQKIPEIITISAQWLACSEISCVPEQAMIVAKQPSPQMISRAKRAFEDLDAGLPDYNHVKGRYTNDGHSVRAFVPVNSLKKLPNGQLQAFPATAQVFNHSKPLTITKNRKFLIIAGEITTRRLPKAIDFVIVANSDASFKPQRLQFIQYEK